MNILMLLEDKFDGTRTYDEVLHNWDYWLEGAVVDGWHHLNGRFGFFCLDIAAYGAMV